LTRKDSFYLAWTCLLAFAVTEYCTDVKVKWYKHKLAGLLIVDLVTALYRLMLCSSLTMHCFVVGLFVFIEDASIQQMQNSEINCAHVFLRRCLGPQRPLRATE